MPEDDDKFTLPQKPRDEAKPYELIPVPPPAAPPPEAPARENPSFPAPRPSSATGEEKTALPQRETRPAKLSGKGLLDDFDEDADFEKDPEAANARRGTKSTAAGRASRGAAGGDRAGGDQVGDGGEDLDAELDEPLVSAGRLGRKSMGIAGLGAVVIAIVNASRVGYKLGGWELAAKSGVNVAYQCLMNLILGVAALTIAAFLMDRRMGRLDLAVTRMLLAVAVFQLVGRLHLTSAGVWLELPLAFLAYAFVLKSLFRFPPQTTAIIAGCHFALWVIFQIGPGLESWATLKPSP